ncbi:hypothetical protein L6452_01848 [Arctium lappa]|uniref:Uncharacterized protein n=1 Tax=Arctium lappa TaxID=4217 RepID=A0ACB9FI10_ARCLA|nr:hypothetical protein L6452_01848 [Arctium lappa]
MLAEKRGHWILRERRGMELLVLIFASRFVTPSILSVLSLLSILSVNTHQKLPFLLCRSAASSPLPLLPHRYNYLRKGKQFWW